MKTWQAALAHIALTSLQSASAVAFFDNSSPNGMLANTGLQIGAQFGLTALQLYVAKLNSNTDPQGNKLIQIRDQKYISSEK